MSRGALRLLAPMTLCAVVALLAACGPEAPERLVESAKQRIANGDYRAASIELRNALQQNPKLAEARLLLAKTLLEDGDGPGAEIEVQKAIEFGLPREQANPVLARAALLSGKMQLVVIQFSDAPALTAADRADLHATVAHAHLLLRALDNAESEVRRALEADPTSVPAKYVDAMLKHERRNVDGALATLDELLKRSPRFAGAHVLKGQVLAAKGDVDGAIASHRAAIAIKPHLMVAHSAVVTLLIERGSFEEAGKHLDALAAAASKHPDPTLLRAMLHHRQNNLPAAQASIEQHLSLAPDSIRGLVLAAAIHQELQLHARADDLLQRALARAPNHAEARRLLVAGRLRAGEPAKALEAVPAMLQAAGQDPTALALAAQAYLATGRRDAAARYFEQAAALAPQGNQGQMNLALSHFAKGDSEAAIGELERAASGGTEVAADVALIAAYLRKGAIDKALGAVDRFEKKRPNEALPHHVRGLVHLAANDAAKARSSMERALAIDAVHLPSAVALARLDLIDKKPQQAKQRLERLLARNPNDAHTLFALAEVERLSGGSSEAVGGLLRKAVAAAPSDVTVRVALVDHYVRSKDTRRAVAAAQDALAAVPNRPELFEAAGRAYVAAGDGNQAIGMYARAAQLQPSSPTPLVRMADIQIDARDYAAAERNLAKALEIGPNHVEAQRRLVELEVARNRIPRAIAVAQTVQKQRPKQAIGYVLEGDVHASRKAWTPAAAAYANGLRHAPSSDLAIKAHAAQRLAGQHADARRLAAEWLGKHPGDRAFRVYFAESSLRLRDFAVASEQYRALVAAEPDNVKWLNDLAWTLGQMKDPQAIQYAEKAVALAPDNAAVLDTLGTLLVEAGNTSRGIEHLRKAAALAPERHVIRLNLATALMKSGDKAGARKELQSLSQVGDRFAGQARVAELLKQL